MKIIKNLTFAALAAVGCTLATQPALGQTPVISSFGQNGQLVCTNLQPGSTASVEWASSVLGPWTNNWTGLESVTADSNGMVQVSVPMFYRVRGTPPLPLGKVTWTKWATVLSPRPGVYADMAGVIVGGDVGDGTFTGELLTRVVDPVTGVITVEADYHIHGSLHSFDARIQAVQQVAGVGQKGVITGVVTDGWLQGHAVAGEWTVIPPCGYGGGVGIGNCFDVTLDIKSATPPPPLGQTTFTKWVTAFTNQPGLIANMAGVVGGDVGTGTFAGEVLKMSTDAVTGVTEIVAFYHFIGPAHSFTALVHVLQTGAVTGSKAVIVGVVTDGWLKGHALEGEFTQIAIDHDGGTGYQGTLAIKSAAPPPPLGQATFTKWVTAFPNQPGLIANMAGVVGGDVGTGVYAGEVFKMSTDAVTGVTEIVAFYHLNGPTHSFSALVHVMQTGAVTGSKAVIVGVVTDGWLKGHAVEGEFTQIAIDHDGGTGYQGTLNIK